MGLPSDKQYLIAELSHQINSPLAAIRNALYLASRQTDDPRILRYLALADDEITVITSTLRFTRAVIEDMTEAAEGTATPVPATRRAAALPVRERHDLAPKLIFTALLLFPVLECTNSVANFSQSGLLCSWALAHRPMESST